MLYVYNIWDMTDEFAQKIVSNEDFKQFDSEGEYYIAKFDSIRINGTNIKASGTFSDFVKNIDCENLQVKTSWFDTYENVLELDGESAVVMLADDLKDDYSVYEDRIYNANNMWEEIDRCFNELMVRALELAIEELQREHNKIKRNLRMI